MQLRSSRIAALAALWFLSACTQATNEAPQLAAVPPALNQPSVTHSATPPSVAGATARTLPATQTPAPTNTPPTPTVTPTAIYRGALSPACGQLLPLLAEEVTPPVTAVTVDEAALAALAARMPATAVPALERLINDPGSVGLVAYRVGDEANGIFHNGVQPMPLASVAKLINLVAYVEAAASGAVNPASAVSLAELDAFYLPNTDLGSHNRSLAELDEQGEITGELPGVQLEDVPWMMIRHSSNAAADYLHWLFGQEVIEQTVVELGLESQTAPCPWVGQFLAMANSARTLFNDRAALEAYRAAPETYGRDISYLTDAYVYNEAFRAEERAWHQQTRRPSVDTQRTFGSSLSARGSATDYAGLMAQLAQNGLSNPDSSFLARKYLEWPMVYADNQALFSNLGYKNGSLPGILTTVYYAYPIGETTPIVVALFYRDLPNRTYQQWRRSLPHDEFARWLLYDPTAIPAVRSLLDG